MCLWGWWDWSARAIPLPRIEAVALRVQGSKRLLVIRKAHIGLRRDEEAVGPVGVGQAHLPGISVTNIDAGVAVPDVS
jgi:hypothetical protein